MKPAALALVLLVVMATPARAGVVTPLSTVEEIAIRQSAGLESAFFGPALPAAIRGNSVAVHPVVGAYGYDGLLGGLSAVWHTSRLLPWNAGISVGILDLDVNTWTVAVSSGREVWRSGRSSLAFEGAVGYQFFVEDSNDDTAFWLGDEDFENGEDALVDSFRLLHGMVHAIYSLQLGFFTPSVDLGLTGTSYRMEGEVWDGSFPVTGGASRSEDGSTANVSFGLGGTLDGETAFLFGGMKLTADAVFFQVDVGLRF